MPLNPNIYAQSGRVNMGAGLSDILNEQRGREAQAEQRQNILAAMAMQQEDRQMALADRAAQQQAAQQLSQQAAGKSLNMWLSSAVQSGRPIEEVLPEAIAKGAEYRIDPERTTKHVQSVYAQTTPQGRSDVAFTQAYPELVAKQRAESMFAKPASQAAPSNVGKLLQERESLPPNDPRIAMYDAAIRKETAIASQEKPINWATVQTDTGIVQVNPQTGEVRDLGVKAPPKSTPKGVMTPEQKSQAEITAQATLNQLTKLYEHPGRTSATGASSFMSMIPATDAKSFASELGTFQAKAFLDAVQAMKGLGALTEAEGQRLVASIGALDPSMKEEDFASNLQSVAGEIYSKAKAAGLNVELPSFASNAKQSAQPSATFEVDKEARYQAWKASQGR